MAIAIMIIILLFLILIWQTLCMAVVCSNQAFILEKIEELKKELDK